MTLEDLDRALNGLAQDVEANGAALLEVELDPTRELLEKSILRGATLGAWTTAATDIARAWEAQALLEAHVETLKAARGTRSRLRPQQLLEVEALVERSQLDVPGEPGARAGARELLRRSAAAVAAARAVMVAAGGAWDVFVPRLSAANATLRACADVGVPSDTCLETARRELARLTDAVAGDPLGATPQPLDALEAQVAAVRQAAEALRDFRADAARRLDDARALLAEARRAEEEGRQAHRVALEKIAGPEVPEPVAVPPDLAGELDRVAGLTGDADWSAAAAALEHWTARAAAIRDAARRAAVANREPIAQRDELRGRLGSYQAKAQRLRLLEDAGVAALHERAHRALHTAPTDLREAADLVRSYQRALSARSEREALR